MKTTVDWLTFRCRCNPFDVVPKIAAAFGTVSSMLEFLPGLQAKDGWSDAGEIKLGGDLVLGRVDFGGESQRGWVRVILTGEGCSWVQCWDTLSNSAGALIDAEIRRVDLALTMYRGEMNHDKVKAAHKFGLFTGGGRPPVMRTIESSDPRAGQTVYVGNRSAAKFFRAYDKGLEMLIHCAQKDTITHFGDDRVEDIYRCEVEFKSVDTYLPWVMLTDRDTYFAGAYKFTARLLGMVGGVVIKTLPSFKPLASLDQALENCRVSYGAILRTALQAYDGDTMAVMEKVLGTEYSGRLVQDGVLLIDHPH
jgi:DNA relaxase NicK